MFEPTQVVLAAANPTGYFWVSVLILISSVGVLIYWVYQRRCPKCKRFFAMSKGSGKKRGANWDEWVCYYCAHREWRLYNPNG